MRLFRKLVGACTCCGEWRRRRLYMRGLCGACDFGWCPKDICCDCGHEES